MVNRWLLPCLAVIVLGFTIFPNQVLSLVAPQTSPELLAGEDHVVVTLSVPGMT